MEVLLYEIVMGIVLVTIIALDIHPHKIKNVRESTMSINETNILKGISSVVILFHHLSQRNNGILYLHTGYLAVSIFFFASGFGLCSSWKKQSDYERKIISKKVPQIIAMSIFTILCNSLYYYLIKEPVLYSDIIRILKGNKLLNWYFPCTVILYFLFAFAAIIAKKNEKRMVLSNIIAISILIICLIFLFFMKAIGKHWFISLPAFLLGVIFAIYDRQVKKIKFKNVICIFIIFIPIFVFSNTVSSNGLRIMQLLILSGYFLTSILVCIIAWFWVCGKNSKFIFRYIGCVSAEMILIQGIALSLFRNNIVYVNNSAIWLFLTITMQFALLFLLCPVYKKICFLLK